MGFFQCARLADSFLLRVCLVVRTISEFWNVLANVTQLRGAKIELRAFREELLCRFADPLPASRVETPRMSLEKTEGRCSLFVALSRIFLLLFSDLHLFWSTATRLKPVSKKGRVRETVVLLRFLRFAVLLYVTVAFKWTLRCLLVYRIWAVFCDRALNKGTKSSTQLGTAPS